MAAAATLRGNVEDLLTRLLAGGETDLAERLVHPDLVNTEAATERATDPRQLGLPPPPPSGDPHG